METWKCKCGTHNSEVYVLCHKCGRHQRSSGSIIKLILTVIVIGAMAAAAIYHIKNVKNKDGRKSGSGRTTETVREREE